jgi:hypothetical protein
MINTLFQQRAIIYKSTCVCHRSQKANESIETLAVVMEEHGHLDTPYDGQTITSTLEDDQVCIYNLIAD